MTVHELYDSKKEQYLRYSAELKVYEEQLTAAITNLLDKAHTLQTFARSVKDEYIRNSILAVTARLEENPSVAKDVNVLLECKNKLEEIAGALEREITRELND